MDDLNKLGSNAAMDQLAKGAGDMARIMAAYYTALASMVPSDLATLLTRDYQWLMIHKSVYPDCPPQVVPE